MAKITLIQFLDNFEAKIFNQHWGAVKLKYFQNILKFKIEPKIFDILKIFSKNFICSQILHGSAYNLRYYAWKVSKSFIKWENFFPWFTLKDLVLQK